MKSWPQDYSLSGSQIIFGSALTSSDSIDFIITYGDVLNIGTLRDGSVNTSQLSNDAVETAKINANVSPAKLPSTLDLSSNTVTLNKNVSALVHLATIDASPSASTYECRWTMMITLNLLFRLNRLQVLLVQIQKTWMLNLS